MVLPHNQRAAGRCQGPSVQQIDGLTERTGRTIEEHSDTNVNESPSTGKQPPSQTTVSTTLTTLNTIRTNNQEDEVDADVDFMNGGGGFDDNDD
jgi:hypothetical protein